MPDRPTPHPHPSLRGLTPEPDPVIRLEIELRVLDAPKLLAFAREAYARAWGDGPDGETHWQPASLAEAVYEAVLASSYNPDYHELGLENVDTSGLLTSYRQIDGPEIDLSTVEAPDA